MGIGLSIGYGAVERFGPASGAGWRNYVGCCGVPHLEEVVSLDGSLCPNLVTELADEDWRHNLADEGLTYYFRDLDYFLSRFSVPPGYQVLAVAKEPDGSETLPDPRFEFLGYDLNEAGLQNGTSALTNCGGDHGGYGKAFHFSDLSECGLVVSFEKATRIRRALRRHYPDDPHALCDLHAHWRMAGAPSGA